MEKVIGFRVAVDASGQVRTATPTNGTLPPAVNTAAAGLTRQLRFEPARENGRAVASETTVNLTVRFVAQPGGGYRLVLHAARQSLQGLEMMPPTYPDVASAQNVGATISTALSIRADGRVDALHTRIESITLTSPKPELEHDFRDAVLKAVRHWRFAMDTVNGRPMPANVHLPTNFCLADDQTCLKQLESAVPAHDPQDPAIPPNVRLPVLQPLPPASPAS